MSSYLFEINHPCQAHLFKHIILYLGNQGHKVDVLAKPSEITDFIFSNCGIEYIQQKPKGISLAGKSLKQLSYTRQLLRLHKQNKYDLGIGVSVTIPSVSVISGLNSLVLDDDDKKATPLFAAMAHRSAGTLLRPSSLSFEGNRSNIIYHTSLHELAYLHPDVFTPNPQVLKKQGLHPGDTFFLIRLSALKAHHDIGKKGISRTMMRKLVEMLKKHGRVILLTDESDSEFDTEPLKINPAEIHHLMAFARLVVSNGQTMCSEAACLGVPSVRITDFAGKISYLEELEHTWNLTFGFNPAGFQQALEKITEILTTPAQVFHERQQKLINGKINFNRFLSWFIEDYPKSAEIMKQNPDYQYNFK